MENGQSEQMQYFFKKIYILYISLKSNNIQFGYVGYANDYGKVVKN